MAKRRRENPTLVLSLERNDEMRAIVNEALKRGWIVLDLSLTGTDILSEHSPQVAVINSLPDSPLCRDLRAKGCHVVRMGRLPHPMDNVVPAILEDHVAEGQIAAEHFIERRFRSLAYCGSRPLGDFTPMFERFRDLAIQRGCTCNLLQLSTDGDNRPNVDRYDRRLSQFRKWIRKVPKPLGLLTFSDHRAAMLAEMCREVGLHLPEEVAILGRGNNILRCECVPLTISSIAPNPERRGQIAIEILNQMLDNRPIPKSPVMIPPLGVMTRESTDVFASQDRLVGKALRYIWDNYDQDLPVEHIAARVGLSRRKLERAFRNELNCGVNMELRRKRLEVLCELLLASDEPIHALCRLTGFKSKDYLHRAFKKVYGMTPRQFRLLNRPEFGDDRVE